MSELLIHYKASPTMSRFHRSNAFYRGVMGPVRSGKSTGMCCEVFSRSQRQAPNKQGLRRTRWAVVRNTYGELRDTTIKTWQQWFPPARFGNIQTSSMTHRFQTDLGDGTAAEVEVMFRALDRPEDIAKLLSMELTGAWVNEAREVPKGVIDTLGDRVGQFPAQKDGGCTWRGVFMDTNPPDDDHWWYRLAEVERPQGWQFFKQPGAMVEAEGKFNMNPRAENLHNLEEGYYLTRMQGKSPAYIRLYYCSQYGFVREGKPVFPEYVDALHCTPEVVEAVSGVPIYVGIDFGLTPAAVFAQRLVNGRWMWIDELVTEDMGTVRFAEILKAKMLREYPGYKFEIYGDPAGDQRAQTDERTPFDILQANGIPAIPAPSNDFMLRREAVAVPLSRLIDGQPGLIISPQCVITRKGLAGGYHYKRIQVSGEERYKDMPEKNKYSHPVEAGGYLMIGAGEGNALIEAPNRLRPKINLRQGAGGWMM